MARPNTASDLLGIEKSDTEALEVLFCPIGSHVKPSLIRDLIDNYLLGQLDKETANELRSKIEEQTSSDISISNFVDGESEKAWEAR